jgi:hypothetical protein
MKPREIGTVAFSRTDREFLKSVGISSEPTFAESRLELAERIAKHQAPIQLPIDPDAARLALVRLALQRLLEVEPNPGEI